MSEFEEFYKYITQFAIYETDEKEEKQIIERFWNELNTVPFEKAMARAKDVYRHFMEPCNLNRLSPKVFSGENINPGYFGRIDTKGVLQ